MRINRVTPITPTSLVTLALLGCGDRAVTVDRGRARAAQPRRLRPPPRSCRPPASSTSTRPTACARALDALVESGVVAVLRRGARAGLRDRPRPAPDGGLLPQHDHSLLRQRRDRRAGAAARRRGRASTDRPREFWDEAHAAARPAQVRVLLRRQGGVPRRAARRRWRCTTREWERRARRAARRTIQALLRRIRPFSAHRVLRPFLEAYRVVGDALERCEPADAPFDEAALPRAAAWRSASSTGCSAASAAASRCRRCCSRPRSAWRATAACSMPAARPGVAARRVRRGDPRRDPPRRRDRRARRRPPRRPDRLSRAASEAENESCCDCTIPSISGCARRPTPSSPRSARATSPTGRRRARAPPRERAARAEGSGRGARVAFLSKNSIEYALMFYGASKAGVVPVPLNYRLAPPEWSYIVNDARARAAVRARRARRRDRSDSRRAARRCGAASRSTRRAPRGLGATTTRGSPRSPRRRPRCEVDGRRRRLPDVHQRHDGPAEGRRAEHAAVTAHLTQLALVRADRPAGRALPDRRADVPRGGRASRRFCDRAAGRRAVHPGGLRPRRGGARDVARSASSARRSCRR